MRASDRHQTSPRTHMALGHIDIGGEFKNQARFEREFAVLRA
jgi:hypothetical protein